MSRRFLELTAITAASFLTILLSYRIGFASHNVVSVWPVAALSYWAVRRYGAPAMLAVFIADGLHSWMFLNIPPFVLLTSAGNSVAAWAAVQAERHFSSAENVFQDTRSALAFFLAGFGTLSIVSALIGVTVLSIHFSLAFPQAVPLFWRWSLSDYTGCLVLAPLIFTVRDLPASLGHIQKTILDGLACLAAIVLVWSFSYSSLSELYGHYPTILITMPLILWIAYRADTPRVCLAFTLVSVSALIITLASVSDLNDSSWLAVQLYLTLVVACGYILHIVQLDRVRLLRELGSERNLLEERVKEQTRDLRREVKLRTAISEKLREAGEKSRAASQAKSEFLANMSHEIRTPLNGVIGALQLLKDTPLKAGQQELVTVAGSCGRGLLVIINNILDLSKIEAGKLEINRTPLDIRALASDVLEGFKASLRNDRVELILNPARNLPKTIVSDGLRLRQILYNLVGNALKFTTEGSVTVSISINPVVEPGTDTQLILKVIDTGTGIPTNLMETIFEPFTQAEDHSSRTSQGTGLGLNIVQRLTRLMGGHVTMDSTEGIGTTVTVTTRTSIPEQQPEVSPAPASPETGEAAAAGPMRILLAEDNKVNQLIIQKYLKKAGHTVITAENGARVLELLPEAKADCILMDIQMPIMDGLEATRAIRNHDRGEFDSAIPIVAMTAYAMAEDRDRFLEAGMDRYISKPVNLKLLSRELATISARKTPFPAD